MANFAWRTELTLNLATLGLVGLLLAFGVAPGARAACITNGDPAYGALQTAVDEDASRALKLIQSQLDSLEAASIANPGSQGAALAALYALKAQAYAILELDSDSRAAAQRGLAIATDVHDPVHLSLLTAYDESFYDEAGIKTALQEVETARAAQDAGSLLETCLLVTRGLLEFRQDRADLAIVSLTQAYRASTSEAFARAHIETAAILSVVMRGLGDYSQALALNEEKVEWDTAHHATLSLSVSRFLRGQILKLMGNYGAALEEFAQARALSQQVGDTQGIAFADLRTCEVHIELESFVAAQRECEMALSVFAKSRSGDITKDAQSLLARIQLGEGHPEKALALLNAVLDQGGADMSPRHVAAIFQWRARANADLHDYRDAYRDLREYLQRYVAANDRDRSRQVEALRARFETDREIERNASLKRELALSQEHSQRQAQTLRWIASVVVMGVLVIALLVYLLLVNRRFRQQLVKLASEDGLTELPNRRRTVELATLAFDAASAQRPLTLALIDMDHFKIINDRCGHATGDTVLREFARTGRACLRPNDTLGRWGGEEFLLIMPDATLEQAIANLERLRTLICGIRLPASGIGMRVTLSAGLALHEGHVKSLDELVARADSALYSAKNDGRDCVRVADMSLTTGSLHVRRVARI